MSNTDWFTRLIVGSVTHLFARAGAASAMLGVALLVAGCTATQGPTVKQDFKVVVGAAAEMTTFDVHNEAATTNIQQKQVFEGLTFSDPQRGVQPALATAWKLVDPTTWEFALRKGVKFQNGDDFTAQDVKWNFDRIMTANASGPKKFLVGWFASLDIVDDYTVRLKTSVPYPSVLGNMNQIPIMPKKAFEAAGADAFNKQPIGTGPFKVASWKINDALDLQAYDGYWAGRPKVDNLVIRVIPDESTRIAEMRSGGVDILYDVPPARATELQQAGVSITSVPAVVNLYIGMNTHAKPLDDARVREATAHAVDVDAMIKTVLGGNGERANSLVHKTSFGWNPNLQVFNYDPAKAKTLLAAAGYPNGFKTTLEAPSSLWPAAKEAAEAISGYLAAVGITAEVQIREFGDYFTRLQQTKLQNLYLWGAVSTDLDAAVHVNLNFHCPPSGRGLYWCSPQTDQLIEQARVEMNPEQRKTLYWKVQDIFHDEVAGVPLWQNKQIAAVSKRVKWIPAGDQYIFGQTISPASQ